MGNECDHVAQKVMPSTPPRPCRHPACPALVHDGSGYCPAHAQDRHAARKQYDATTRKDDPALAYAAEVRNGSRWRKVRAIHRAQYPLCCDPFNDHAVCNQAASNEQSHHVISLAQIFKEGTHEMAYDLGNLAPLCTRCHAKVEGMERRGVETAGLFARVVQAIRTWFA